MKAQNEKEFKALIKTYESITLEQLQKTGREVVPFYSSTLTRITGFGGWGTCTLCKPISTSDTVRCKECVYFFTSEERMSCAIRENFESYHDIEKSSSIENLLTAIKARAKHMRKVWKQYLKIRS